jgi:chromosome segregation ATPase
MDMEKNAYRTALEAIRERIDNGESAELAADTVTHQFRRLIGDDAAASESLYEEAAEYEEQREDYLADSYCCSQDPSMRDTHGVPGRDL